MFIGGEIRSKRQAQCSCNKTEICAAKGYEASKQDDLCPFFLKICIGSFKAVPGFRESFHDFIQERVTSKSSDAVAKGSADQSGNGGEQHKQRVKNPLFRRERAAERQDDLGGNREAGVFEQDKKQHGRHSIACEKRKEPVHEDLICAAQYAARNLSWDMV